MRKKMKVSELDEVDLGRPDPEWSEAALEYAFRLKELHEFLDQDPVMQILRLEQIGERKGPVAAPVMTDNKLDAVKDFMGLLKVTGLIVGAFDVNDLFDLDVKIIQSSHRMFFDKLKVLVGETTTNPGPVVLDSVSPLLIGPTGGWTSSSSIGVVDPGSDAPPEPPRTALGPSGPTAIAPDFDAVTGRLESHFQGATSRFLKENEAFIPAPVAEVSQNPGSQDVEVESAGSQDHSHWDNDPDDIDFQPSAPPALATATAISAESRAIQRFQISAISELKEFSGKVPDEDRARTWISKVKSSFRRDHVSDEEKCLTLAELLSGPAKNWHRQLPRTTRNKWSDLLRSFRIQYCGFGVSGVHQYYQAHKRPDESALEYLYRLNVAGLRARLKIKDGGSKERREHVVHFIDTSGDEDLADQLTLLRLPDVDELEAGLRALDRAKNRRKTSALESDNCPLKGLPTPPQAPAVYVRAIKIQATGSEYDSEGDGSVFDEDYPRRVYLAAGNKR
ncbi:hypothetical protein PR002_g28752 [Phytophthora rubi]|nr:hypothetical protein PR002_g28752 [Phytophthora rubi]